MAPILKKTSNHLAHRSHKIIEIGIRYYVLVCLFIVSILLQHPAGAQDANFSQYYAAPLYLNPALVGTTPHISVGVNYRSKLKSALFPRQSSQLSFIFPITTKSNNNFHKGGIGLSAFNETAGQNENFKVLGLNISGAYNLMLDSEGKSKITFALQAGIVNKSIDFRNLTWGSQFDPFIGFDTSIDPSVTTIRERTSYPAFNVGLMFYRSLGDAEDYGSNVYFGFSAGNLNEPNESLIEGEEVKLPRLFKLHGGFDIGVSEKASISPNVLVKYQNEILQINAGTYVYYNLSNISSDSETPSTTKLIAGVWFRHRDSFIFAGGVSKNKLTFGFSYDLNASDLKNFEPGPGAYEISVTYKVLKKKKVVEQERIHRPRFTL
ncbi:PorP/SprF family type IX secretion system membrane protein [Fulvivirgaceae bacterium BMA10]|uniref:PorP/SprF family type IX secretion system membrane protein n=1 Tax=Splendidivirga corallicola TaxID=3051826 RepID=A0ABT8KUF5_9BACT|nr:PorP/SprF family type IX secretion system membrane protein [Fulvivirgaceae bacterium BMA10]